MGISQYSFVEVICLTTIGIQMWFYDTEILLSLIGTLKKAELFFGMESYTFSSAFIPILNDCSVCRLLAARIQVLLELPHMEGIIFDIKFTYLKVVDTIWDF